MVWNFFNYKGAPQESQEKLWHRINPFTLVSFLYIIERERKTDQLISPFTLRFKSHYSFMSSLKEPLNNQMTDLIARVQ